jgi:hypothetical protein
MKLTWLLILIFASLAFEQSNAVDDDDNFSYSAMYGNHVQGDMVFTKNQNMARRGSGRRKSKKTGLIDSIYRWPKKNGKALIPYRFEDENEYSE